MQNKRRRIKSRTSDVETSNDTENEKIDNKRGKTLAIKSLFRPVERQRIKSRTSEVEPSADAEDENVYDE